MNYLNHIAKLGKSIKGQSGCQPSPKEMNLMQEKYNNPKIISMKTKIWNILNSID